MTLYYNVMKAQVENVSIDNQVYEFLNRMNIAGFLPQYSNSILPVSRKEVGEMLLHITKQKHLLSTIDLKYLNKFTGEFALEMKSEEHNSVLFLNEQSLSKYWNDVSSSNEKYLYTYNDSSTTMFAEFISAFRYKNNYSTEASFSTEQHGGRIRGTFQNRLGYYIATTNGTVFGNRNVALNEPRLHQNFKFNNLNTPYFDETEAYVRADAGLFQIEAGREFTNIGTGYSDKLLLSDNASMFDMVRLDAQYKSVRFFYLQGKLEHDRTEFPGLTLAEDTSETKYLAMHRIQFPLFNVVQIGMSEMIIYQRFSPEWAYLNPFTFYKSLEHALGDRDNSLMSFDI